MDPQPVPQPQKRSSIFLPIFLGLLCLLFAVSTGYLYYQNLTLQKKIISVTPTPAPTVQPTPATDATANWNTYVNARYGISFKYPDTATYKTVNYPGSLFDLVFTGLSPSITTMTVYIGNNWYSSNPNASASSNFTVGGIPAHREDLALGQNPPQTVIYVKNGGYYVEIQLVKDPNDPNIEATFDRILSTFQFTAMPTPMPTNVTCTTDADCPSGTTCETYGPIVVNGPQHKECVAPGQPIPL